MDNRYPFLATFVCIAANGLSASEPIVGETSDAEAYHELPPYVVVSTRTPLGLDRASPSVSYVSDEEIDFWQDRSLVDSLSREPGMVLWSNGASGSLTSLSIRGTESNHTAFFMDGRRLNPGFGNQYNVEFLNSGNADSVQVQRGASSVNYGSSGIGGVVELRSKSALDTERDLIAVEGELGSNEFYRGAVEAQIREGKFGVSLEGTHLETENERANDGYDKAAFSSRFDYMLTDALYFEIIGYAFDAERESAGSTASPTPDAYETTESWLVSPGFRYLTDTLSVHAFYSRSELERDIFAVNSAFDDFWNYLGDFPVSNTIEIDSDEWFLQADYTLSENSLLTTGVVYRRDQARNSNLNTFEPLGPVEPYSEVFEQVGVYGQIIWLIGDIELRGGIRYDDYSEFDSQLTGHVEAIYYFDELGLSFFAKAASSYAPPGAADIAFDSVVIDTPLQPEEAESYEIGFRHQALDERLSWSLIYFNNHIDELLSFRSVEIAPSVFEFDTFNLEEATTSGVEFAVDFAYSEKMNLGLAYTYLDTEDEETGERLVRRPRHLLALTADYALTDGLRVGVSALGQFDRKDTDPVSFTTIQHEDFFTVQAVFEWAVNESWTIFGRAENLLDESYEPVAGYPALGRAGYLGARFEF